MATVLTKETHLTETKDKLHNEIRFLDILKYIELLLGLGLIIYSFTIPADKSGQPQFWGGLLIFLGICHFMKASENRQSSKLFEYGRKGEEKVASTFEKELPDSFWLLNDMVIDLGGLIKKKQAQIDHIVVGPGGIFVIETKAYTGRLRAGRNETELTQEKWNSKGKKEIKKLTNPVLQNEYHIDVLKKYMTKKGLMIPSIYSVIVFTNSKVSYELESEGHYIFKNISAAATFMVTKSSDVVYDQVQAKGFLSALGLL